MPERHYRTRREMTGRTAIQTGRSDWLNGLLAIFSESFVGSVAALLFRSYAQKNCLGPLGTEALCETNC